MWVIFETKTYIHQSKQSNDNLDEKILFDEITHFQDPQIRKKSVIGLHGNQEFHIPLCTMIYLALKSKFNAIVSFRNRNFNFNSK